MAKIVVKQDGYQLEYDKRNKLITLKKESTKATLMTASFFLDKADGGCVLSHFQNQTKDKGLARITADLVSVYISAIKNGCKLFCYADQFEEEFIGSAEFRSKDIDRLMIRTKQEVTLAILPQGIKIATLDPKKVNDQIMDEMIILLKTNTYWGVDADKEYFHHAFSSSTFVLATNQNNNVIGFVRFIANKDIAYISDMVVDEKYRKQNIGTGLMQQACLLIDAGGYKFSALISAKQGDGFHAAPKLYGEKFKFTDYSKKHEFNIYFSYIRFNKENELRYKELQDKQTNAPFLNHLSKSKMSNPHATLIPVNLQDDQQVHHFNYRS